MPKLRPTRPLAVTALALIVQDPARVAGVGHLAWSADGQQPVGRRRGGAVAR